jgi:Sap, sulfolipid-1-addressing protein
MDSSTHLQILPLALIMVMGPQILTAIFLVTSHQPVKNSGAMLVGVILAASASVLLWFGLVDLIGIDPKDGGGPTTVDWVVAGLLALLAIRVFMTRGTAETPKRAFTLAFLLIFLMPTDIVAVISTVNFLHDNGLDAVDGWPLVAATTVLMALPIAAYLLLGHRARDAMPRIRDWLTTNAWVVNLVVIVYFIYQTLS